MNENRSYGTAVVILFFLYIFILGDLEHMIRERSKVSFLSDKYMESPQFRIYGKSAVSESEGKCERLRRNP